MAAPSARKTGLWGEELAARFLSGQGAAILHRNWRSGRNEIDLIAEWNGVVVFVEVKLRKTNAFGHPETFLGKAQIRNIRRASTEYQIQHGITGTIRFDIVAITGTRGNHSLLHLPDAF